MAEADFMELFDGEWKDGYVLTDDSMMMAVLDDDLERIGKLDLMKLMDSPKDVSYEFINFEGSRRRAFQVESGNTTVYYGADNVISICELLEITPEDIDEYLTTDFENAPMPCLITGEHRYLIAPLA